MFNDTTSPGGTLKPATSSGVRASAGNQPVGQYLPSLALNIALTIERRLPIGGDVLVAVGQRVQSDNILARTTLPGRPRVFNLCEFFEETPANIARFLKKEPGSRVNKGDVLASGNSLLRRKAFKAPFEGALSAFDANSGYISLTPMPQPYNLESYVGGTVTSIIERFGANVEVQASYARGSFGFGGERHGVLRALVTRNTDPIDPATIDSRTTNFIVLGGSYITAEALQRAVELKVRGIITGSIREEELTKFLEYRQRSLFYRVGQHAWRFPADLSGKDSPLTLIVTEGFGMRPMASRLFELLLAHNGYELSINGTTRLRRGFQRPEVIVPILTSAESVRKATQLGAMEQLPRVGSIVRLLNPTYLGAVGTVVGLPPNRRTVNPGQLDRLAEVEVSGMRTMFPFADIEVLEQTDPAGQSAPNSKRSPRKIG